MSNQRSSAFDVVVWGATGFTGRLVAEDLLRRYGCSAELPWAIGGRNLAKLEQVRDQLAGIDPAAADLPILVADSQDSASLTALAQQARVVCSTVGPYTRYGTPLVQTCAELGVHYCDITGEVPWMRGTIDAFDETARASGAKIVHCCGFDAIPSDLGCLLLQREMLAREGRPCDDVSMVLLRSRGGMSGGTAASMLELVRQARASAEVRRILANPYALDPAGASRGPDGPDQRGVRWDTAEGCWTAPFVMASINTRVVRRSNALMDYAYGRGFRYREAMSCGKGPTGWLAAGGVSAALAGFTAGLVWEPTRALLQRFLLPEPGDGPSAEKRERGSFEIALVGSLEGKVALRATVAAQGDPGYQATATMLTESAVCLARGVRERPDRTGVLTPATAMGWPLIERLRAAGMTLAVASASA